MVTTTEYTKPKFNKVGTVGGLVGVGMVICLSYTLHHLLITWTSSGENYCTSIHFTIHSKVQGKGANVSPRRTL